MAPSLMVEAAPASAPPQSHPRRPLRRVVLLVLAFASLALGFEVHRVTLGDNLHTIISGRAYRCAQPSAAALDQMISRYGIRTVINLRGNCDSFDWYLDEARTTHNHNISQEDICFSAGRLPSVPELRRFMEVLDRTAYPILLHCRRGADRTGMASAIVVLLTTDSSLAAARWQMNPRFGHVALGRTAQPDLVLDFYEDWLRAEGKSHSPDAFRHWALHHYRPGNCLADLTFLSPPPTHVARGTPIALHVRAHNSGIGPWQLNPLVTAGTHLGCHIYDDHDRVIDVVKTGLRDGLVAPGQTADFTLVLPALYTPGRYRLQLDMVDEQQCWFYQTGSEPLELEVVVRE